MTGRLTGYPDDQTVRMAKAVARAAKLDSVADIIDALRDRVVTAEAKLAARSPHDGASA